LDQVLLTNVFNTAKGVGTKGTLFCVFVGVGGWGGGFGTKVALLCICVGWGEGGVGLLIGYKS
jgi:hypothetical protein